MSLLLFFGGFVVGFIAYPFLAWGLAELFRALGME